MEQQYLLTGSLDVAGRAIGSIAYLYLDNCVSYFSKLIGLFSRERKERSIISDLVKTINEECLHVLINNAYPRLSAESHHSVMYELRCVLGIDQYHYHDSSFSREARGKLMK